MKRAGGIILAVVLGAALVGPSPASEARPFGGPYFSAEVSVPQDDAGWTALAETHPTRIKRVAAESTPLPRPPAATRLEVRQGLDYVRVRHLANDLAVIEGALESPMLIVDLRYVRGDLTESLALGSLFARKRLTLDALANADSRTEVMEPGHPRGPQQTTLVLVNRATAGPLEAVLDALQAAGEILLVGTQTAGDTGLFVSAPSAPGWSVILDDYRRKNGSSLLDVGVTPGLFVETTRDADDDAYLALDAGSPLADLLDAPVQKARFDEARLLQQFDQGNGRNGPGRRPAAPSNPTNDDGDAGATARSESAAPFDRTLQRAVGTLVAAETLGRISSPSSAAATSGAP